MPSGVYDHRNKNTYLREIRNHLRVKKTPPEVIKILLEVIDRMTPTQVKRELKLLVKSDTFFPWEVN